MLDDYSEIRLFLLKEGFAPIDRNMMFDPRGFSYSHRSGDVMFFVDLTKAENQVTAEFPDYQYNMRNVHAPIKVVIDYSMDLTKDPGINTFNLSQFFETALNKAKECKEGRSRK